jgi:membrane fusion protein (multidrug efflux system)
VGTMWVIDKGLQPGERVVVEGFTKVKSGAAVVPQEAPQEAPSEAAPEAPAAGGK